MKDAYYEWIKEAVICCIYVVSNKSRRCFIMNGYKKQLYVVHNYRVFQKQSKIKY